MLGTLFLEWSSISPNPMFWGEFGTDAFNQTSGSEDQLQANFNGGLWDEIATHLSADDPQRSSIGACVFAWNDKWWKAGNLSSHDGDATLEGGHRSESSAH